MFEETSSETTKPNSKKVHRKSPCMTTKINKAFG